MRNESGIADIMRCSVKRLSASFGLEIKGLDLCGTDQPAKEFLAPLLEEELVLVVRNQNHLTIAEQVRATSIFGNIETPWDTNHKHPDDERVQIISNANRKGIKYKSSTLYWHSDQSFVSMPSPVTMLRAVKVPSAGGCTLFADLRQAFADLGPELKAKCRAARAEHSFAYLMGPLIEKRQGPQAAAPFYPRYPAVKHPLVVRHPSTRRESLFLNELCITRIDSSLSESEGTELLSFLFRHVQQDKYIYRHKWQVGDVVIWYNPGLIHRAEDIPTEEPRLFYRTNTQGRAVECS